MGQQQERGAITEARRVSLVVIIPWSVLAGKMAAVIQARRRVRGPVVSTRASTESPGASFEEEAPPRTLEYLFGVLVE
jgi:hypothetical protein